MQFSPPSHHSIPLWSKYSPQHPVPSDPYSEYPQILNTRKWEGQTVISTSCNKANYSLPHTAVWNSKLHNQCNFMHNKRGKPHIWSPFSYCTDFQS
jgi:hypothetical protein